MNSQGTNTRDLEKEIREGISNYRTTIKVIQAFISLITWDVDSKQQVPAAQFTIGRKMDTSPDNKVERSKKVTPDIVIQQNGDLGYIVEAKSTLPRNHHNNWLEYVEQLQKYDDDLTGWWTKSGRIRSSNIVLLLDVTTSNVFKKFIQELMDKGEVAFRNPVSIVEFSRLPRVSEFWFLRKYWGEIEDQVINAKLEDGQPIAIDKVIGNPIYGEKKFYDARPPYVEHTMEELWQNIFNEMKQGMERDEKLRAWPLLVDVGKLTKELQRLYGSVGGGEREVSFPLVDWVREALDAFVYLGLARKNDKPGSYTILFKLIEKEDLITYFARWRGMADKEKRRDKSKQLPLPL